MNFSTRIIDETYDSYLLLNVCVFVWAPGSVPECVYVHVCQNVCVVF